MCVLLLVREGTRSEERRGEEREKERETNTFESVTKDTMHHSDGLQTRTEDNMRSPTKKFPRHVTVAKNGPAVLSLYDFAEQLLPVLSSCRVLGIYIFLYIYALLMTNHRRRGAGNVGRQVKFSGKYKFKYSSTGGDTRMASLGHVPAPSPRAFAVCSRCVRACVRLERACLVRLVSCVRPSLSIQSYEHE